MDESLLAVLRARVADHYYERADVLDRLARRILSDPAWGSGLSA